MTPFEWVAAMFVAVVCTARITRLITFDLFPPMVWLRGLWEKITRNGDWALLFFCGYCMGFWVACANVAWAYLSDFSTAWWIFNSAWTVAYLAPILMVHDGDDG